MFIVSFSAFAGEQSDFYKKLAAQHAPVLYQGQGKYPQGDVFTTIDFDGDLNSDNNWSHVSDAEKKGSYVYFDVIETKSHYFITYGLFYPRDYAPICFWFLCHENDFEGMRVTVEKTPEHEFGKAIMMETQAHGGIQHDSNPVFENNRIVAVVEKEGHGMHSKNDRGPDKQSKIYHYTGNAHSENGYDLLSMDAFWESRHQIGNNQMWRGTFNFDENGVSLHDLPAAFGGKKWGKGGANPPWAWKPRGLKKGEWFFDPAAAVCKVMDCPPNLDPRYVYNPYLGID